MLLAVDSGNTRVKWALVDALVDADDDSDGAGGVGGFDVVDGADVNGGGETRMRRAGAAAKNDLRHLSALLRRLKVAPVWVSFVGADADRARLQDALKNHRARWLKPPVAANRYRPPQSLGVDRWLAAVAARAANPRPCVILSAGSAITVDYVDADGVFAGGIILPGLTWMRDAICQRAHLQQRLSAGKSAHRQTGGGDGFDAGGDSDLEKWIEPFPTKPGGGGSDHAPTGVEGVPVTTADGVDAGAVLAAAGAAREFRRSFAPRARVIITGGDAPRLLPFFPRARHIPDLVLRGIAVCWRQHRHDKNYAAS